MHLLFIKESNNDISIKEQEEDIEINFLESLNESNEYISCDSENGENIIKNVLHEDDEDDDEPYQHAYFTRSKARQLIANEGAVNDTQDFKEQNEIKINKTNPIQIPESNSRNSRTNYLKCEYEYEFIDKTTINQQSAPVRNRTITESFKEYLYESVSLLKHSYKYITNNKSI